MNCLDLVLGLSLGGLVVFDMGLSLRWLREGFKRLNELDGSVLNVLDLAHRVDGLRLAKIRRESNGNARYLAAEAQQVLEQSKQRVEVSLKELSAVRKAAQQEMMFRILSIVLNAVALTSFLQALQITYLGLAAIFIDIVASSIKNKYVASDLTLHIAHLESLRERFGLSESIMEDAETHNAATPA